MAELHFDKEINVEKCKSWPEPNHRERPGQRKALSYCLLPHKARQLRYLNLEKRLFVDVLASLVDGRDRFYLLLSRLMPRETWKKLKSLHSLWPKDRRYNRKKANRCRTSTQSRKSMDGDLNICDFIAAKGRTVCKKICFIFCTFLILCYMRLEYLITCNFSFLVYAFFSTWHCMVSRHTSKIDP